MRDHAQRSHWQTATTFKISEALLGVLGYYCLGKFRGFEFPKQNERKRGRHASKEFTSGEKKAIGRFALALRDRKWKWGEVLALCDEAEYEVPDATLREWVSLVREGTTPISEEKGSSVPALWRTTTWP